MVTRMRRRQGFTLLELMVAGVVALIILGGALALLLQGSALRRRQQELGEMNRDASRVVVQLSAELRQVGLGRPRGARILSTGTGELFPPSFLIATPTRVTFVADLPRTNSSFNGFSYPADDQFDLLTSLAPGVSVLNEFNGTCEVAAVLGANCETKDHSMVFNPAQTNNTDCLADSNSLSCPWSRSLRKYQSAEYVIVADTAGRWVERQLDAANPPVVQTLTRKGLKLSSPLPSEMVGSQPNRGFISTPDRVSYRIVPDGGTPVTYRLERMQCWGQLAAASVTIATASADCAAGAATGTGWEILLRGLPAPAVGVPSFFTYLDYAGNPLTAGLASTDADTVEESLRRIRRVNVSLVLNRETGRNLALKKDLKHSTFVSIHVRQ